MELKPHQQIAVDCVKDKFKDDNKTIVVHPTGMGKTYVALKLFDENKNKNLMFVAPSTSILWQFKQNIAREYGVRPNEYKKVFPNLEFITYQKMVANSKKNDNYIQEFNNDLVVFDEAHHLGARNWGKLAQNLIKKRKDINFLGLTATPERTDGIDVVKEVFDGNLADEITLEEAVATRQLKMPNYITALYSYEPIIEELELGLEAIQDKYPEKYLMLKKDIERAKKMIEKSSGLPEIFAKHMVKKDGKYIVFCKDIEHLKKMVEIANTQGWFDGVNENVEILSIHSEEDDKTNKAILKRFRDNHTATKNTLRILFSVEKINEGLHLDDIAGEIMLRPTKSKIVFRQQLGRIMSITSNNERSVVFDIVDNIDSFEDIKDFMDGVRQLGGRDIDEEDLEEDLFEDFYIADETREAREILRKIAGGLELEWEESYQRSVKWRADNKGKTPKWNSKEERRIYDWEKYQKIRYLKAYQDADPKDIPPEYIEKVNKLKALGLIYTPSGFVSIQEKIDIVVAYLSNSNNSPDIKATDKLEDGTKIGVYVQDIRSDFKEGKLTDPQIEQLQGKGFIWRHPRKLKEKNIDDKIDIVANYLSNPDNDPHIKKDQILEDGTTIGLYVGDIRSKKDELTKEQKNKLGNKFIWEKKDTSKNKTIQEKIDIVVEYLTNKDNDPHIKSNQILEDGTPIGDYVDYIRGKYKEEKLTAPQIEQLQGKGFIWQERDSSRRKTNQDKIDVIVQYLSNSDNNPNLTTKQILEDGTPIGTYVSDIRKAYNKNKLGSKQIKQLTDVSFSWKDVKKQNAKTIDDKIDIVVEYLSNPKNNPHIKTTQVLEDGTPIGEHVKFIRKKRKEGKLDKKQIKRLGDGFIWEASEFKGLKEQKEKELSILEDLKQKAEQAENLEIESQVALENVINKNSRKPEGPGE